MNGATTSVPGWSSYYSNFASQAPCFGKQHYDFFDLTKPPVEDQPTACQGLSTGTNVCRCTKFFRSTVVEAIPVTYVGQDGVRFPHPSELVPGNDIALKNTTAEAVENKKTAGALGHKIADAPHKTLIMYAYFAKKGDSAADVCVQNAKHFMKYGVSDSDDVDYEMLLINGTDEGALDFPSYKNVHTTAVANRGVDLCSYYSRYDFVLCRSLFWVHMLIVGTLNVQVARNRHHAVQVFLLCQLWQQR
jgi:hypothetical protein